jgi:hypothetical protein
MPLIPRNMIWWMERELPLPLTTLRPREAFASIISEYNYPMPSSTGDERRNWSAQLSTTWFLLLPHFLLTLKSDALRHRTAPGFRVTHRATNTWRLQSTSVKFYGHSQISRDVFVHFQCPCTFTSRSGSSLQFLYIRGVRCQLHRPQADACHSVPILQNCVCC